jgi:hypothetical protein
MYPFPSFTVVLVTLLATVAGLPSYAQLLGPSAVCQYGTYDYSVVMANGGTCFWYLPTGGQLSQNTGQTVTVTWTGNPQSNHLMTVVVTDTAGTVDEFTLTVGIMREQLTCNNAIQSSLDTGGQILVTPDILLEGNYNTYAGYVVTIYTSAGIWPSNILDCSLAGQSVTAEVTDTCAGNSCQTTLHILDLMPPVIQCPSDTIVLTCQAYPELFPPPPATDNCDVPPMMALTNFELLGDSTCGGTTFRKSWIATDDAGNLSATCQQYLFISPLVSPLFPPDREWTCLAALSFPSGLDATPYTGDPATGGSGIPTGVTGNYCPAGYTHHDDTLAACGNNITILRTWFVFNWCTGEVVLLDNQGNDNVQYVHVKDNLGPQVSVPPFTMPANNNGAGSPQGCLSTGFVPAPVMADECNDIQLVRIFSPVGEIVYLNGVDGQAGGHVPPPGLPLGIHMVQYQVTDACGNQTLLDVAVTIADEWQPVAVCDDFTTVSLDNDGYAWITPQTVDAGSYDNCCLAGMSIRREDDSGTSFSDAVWVECTDDTVLVTMQVKDCEGHVNECTVHILVKDQIGPSCLAPPGKQIACGDVPTSLSFDWLSGFGTALGTDNCGSIVEELAWSVLFDDCGAGEITRHFTVSDPAGNVSAPCSQLLQVISEEDWMVVFPADWTGTCFDPLSPDTLVLSNFGCTLLAVSHFDQPAANPSDSACTTIVRTWMVSNWCLEGTGAPTVDLPHQSGGVFLTEADVSGAATITYEQYINIQDDQAPQLSPGFDSLLTIPADTCLLAGINLPVIITGECTASLDIEHYLDLSADGTTDAAGAGQFTGDVPTGCHQLRYLVRDGCNNASELSVSFCVQDGKAPVAVCTSGLSASLSDSGEVLVCAAWLDGGSYDYCGGPLSFSFSTAPTDTCLWLTCEDTGAPYQVAIWVTDPAGNQSYCITELDVEDNAGVCQLAAPLLGIITNEEEQPLQGVTVSLSGGGGNNNTVTTDAAGTFYFANLQAGQDYTISPYKNDDHRNGVTTLDILLIQEHVLGNDLLDSPYQLIAADVNKSKTVTTLDIVLISKLLLFEIDYFPGNVSWRFIRKDHIFSNPGHPWTGGFPEVYNINDFVPGWASADFIAVKVGDVNGSAATNLVHGPVPDCRSGGSPLRLVMVDHPVSAGSVHSMSLSAEGFDGLRGMQFLLKYDTSSLECLGLDEKSSCLLGSSSVGLASLLPGSLPVSWTARHPLRLTEGQVVVTFNFRARRSGRLSEWIAIDRQRMEAVCYNGGDFDAGPVVLKVSGDDAGDQNRRRTPDIGEPWPNPFRERFRLQVHTTLGEPVQVRLHDLSGRLLLEERLNTTTGWNDLPLALPPVLAGRMLRLEVISSQGRAYRWIYQAGF